MIANVLLHAWVQVVVRAAATPTPTPSTPPDDSVTPGVFGFGAIFLIAVVIVLLVIDMVRRIRRVRYRAEIQEMLDAEEADRGPENDTAP
ncbi:MAG: hypothetical protein QOH55_603 [Microbacteriaceae bacterium]|nr:hypothetical protein [Microbacteriaceae bacterium]MDQ1608656.1 hypothetical protein [Microbacteriaceae bacterium]